MLKINSKIEVFLHDIFEVGIFIKGFNALWEITSGSLILFLSKSSIDKIFYFLASKELSEDPNDLLFGFVSKSLQNFSHNTQIFIVAYLLIHGFLNLFLAIQLYRDKIWAYLANIIVMTIFIFYQIHRVFIHHSPVLTVITIFDVLFILLTWHEYRYKKYGMVV